MIGHPLNQDHAKQEDGFEQYHPEQYGHLHLQSTLDELAKNVRKENSLGSLTSRFMELIQRDGNDTLDLNEAASILDVQKRRIYDITNVLEGIGLIEKKSKSKIVWKGGFIDMSLPRGESYADTYAEVERLRKEEAFIDQTTKTHLEAIKRILDSSDLAYVENSDIRVLDSMKDKTILAVRATHGTHLEVPNPDIVSDTRKFQIYLKSENPIDVFLVSESAEQDHIKGEVENFITDTDDAQNPIELRKEYIFNTCTGGEGISDFL
jgi:transcription factor E2F3